jgi:hypothetical protein
MKHTLKSGLTMGMLVTALALTGGCGDNDNSGNGNDNGNTPVVTRTATPAPVIPTATPQAPVATVTAVAEPTVTPTPTGTTTQQVSFDFTANEALQGFQVNVTYPIANGSFQGSGAGVTCSLTGGGNALFTKNDKDDGNLVLSVAGAENLTFPVNISCTFEGSEVMGSDIALTVTEVTQNNASGNKDALGFTITVSPPA